MKAQRQADSVAAMTAQPKSAQALLPSVAKERLTNGVRSACVAGMKTRPNTDGALARVGQPEPSAVLLRGAAGERLAFGSRCARVAGMNRRVDTQIARGGGLVDLIWRRSRFGRSGVFNEGIVRDLSRQWAADRFSGSEISITVTAAPGSGKPRLLSKASYFSLPNQAGLLAEPPIERIFGTCNFWNISACIDVFNANNKEVIEHVNA